MIVPGINEDPLKHTLGGLKTRKRCRPIFFITSFRFGDLVTFEEGGAIKYIIGILGENKIKTLFCLPVSGTSLYSK